MPTVFPVPAVAQVPTAPAAARPAADAPTEAVCAALRHELRTVRSVVDVLKEVVFQTDAAGRWTFLNPAWTDVLGHDVQASLGTPFLDCVHPEDRERSAALLAPLMEREQEDCRHEIRCVARDGSLRRVEVFARLTLDGQGRVVGTSGTLTDITERRRAEERLRLAASVFEGTHEGIVITDPQGRIVEVNDAFEAVTGYRREQVIGRTPALLSSGRQDRAFYERLWERLLTTGKWSGEIWNRRADGELVAELLRISAVHAEDGELTHYVGIFSDVTGQKRQQEHLERLAHYDALTGLPNRVLALDRLGQLMAGAHRLGPQGGQVAVCYLDLDGFKEVNDRFGHAQGDALLMAAAARMRHAVREGDTVARLGGDEFVLLLARVHGMASVQPVLERVLESLAQPYPLAGEAPQVSASMGVALYPEHGTTADHLLRAADQAMYRAKRLGKNRACMAGDGVERAPAQAVLIEELRTALATDQLRLHYQPKICARTRRVLGVEALVRWQHPVRGLVPPGDFLPVLQGTPLEVTLDLWVLRAGVRQLAQWRAAGRELGMSINVSPGTLVLPDLPAAVAEIVREAAPLQPQLLGGIELEVLETAALADLGAASRAIQTCAEHGISCALDDFGTGYSSLSYLRRLPVRTLKIDRSFVSNMLGDRGDLDIVRAVIGLAEAFGVDTVAEGVETAAHARLLDELGCSQLQGFGIARPMAAPALEAWLDRQDGLRLEQVA
ncbi:putative bifunctional diguanylate cyclase/phosphodiesterase [Azohydromonas lata]|uniref:putative bifunctional diguanylate cyclase/phosphodiesterase n=1 Tax=Azohydromonas lata TaxID=45677 RepID=UPI000830997E|nr:bifunctional diguanylate cyclase/phosphodiesterase [Azohydromonas lata]